MLSSFLPLEIVISVNSKGSCCIGRDGSKLARVVRSRARSLLSCRQDGRAGRAPVPVPGTGSGIRCRPGNTVPGARGCGVSCRLPLCRGVGPGCHPRYGAPMGAPLRPAPPPARCRLTHRTCDDLHGRPGHLLHHAATGPGSARAPPCTTPAPAVFWRPGGRAAKCPDTRSWGRRWPARPRRPCRGVQCGARPAPASGRCRFVSAGTARPSTDMARLPPASARRALPESPPHRHHTSSRTGITAAHWSAMSWSVY